VREREREVCKSGSYIFHLVNNYSSRDSSHDYTTI